MKPLDKPCLTHLFFVLSGLQGQSSYLGSGSRALEYQEHLGKIGITLLMEIDQQVSHVAKASSEPHCALPEGPQS